MESLCKFLSLDLCALLNSLFPCDARHLPECENLGPVQELSYEIRHCYPPRLHTYDAEEINEPRLIRFADLTGSVLNLLDSNCRKRRTHSKRRNKARREAMEAEILDKIHDPLFLLDNFSEQRMQELDHSGQVLYCTRVQNECEHNGEGDGEGVGKCEEEAECEVEGQGDGEGEEAITPPSWEELTPAQKFPFYWKVMTNHDLHSTPYQNFKEIFVTSYLKNCPTSNLPRLVAKVRNTWQSLKSEQRVPFNIHALLYHVSIGAVDPLDQPAMRGLLKRWR